MKKIYSFLSLMGIISLSCSSLSPNPKPTATLEVNSGGQTTTTQDGIPVQEFSLDNVDAIPPEDVQIEISYAPHGGPDDTSYCIDENSNPVIYSEPTIVNNPIDNELMIRSEMIICGWQYRENLKGEIGYPDGRKKTYELTASDDGSVVLEFAPNLDDPEGVYTYSISNGDTTLQSNAYFYAPRVPRLYYLNEKQILFHNFPSSEPVQLIMFSNYSGGDQEADGGMNFVTGNTGELVVTIPDVPNSVYAGFVDGLIYEPIDNVGTSHGDLLGRWNEITFPLGFFGSDNGIEYLEKHKEFEARAVSYKACQNKISTIFESVDFINQYATVAPITLTLYNESRYSAPTLGAINVGQQLRLVSGPFCFDNAVWWAVSHPDFSSRITRINGSSIKISGYVVEIDNQNNHYLEKENCGELPTRLSTNTTARVAFSNGNDKRIRKEPGFSAPILTTIPEGTLVKISGYRYRCVDDTYWWHVYTQDNQEGWMTEMQDGVYFLEPAPK